MPARFDRPWGKPLERRTSITQTRRAVVARVVVTLLFVVIPLAAPVISHEALAMIK
jgi:hypothetical protein